MSFSMDRSLINIHAVLPRSKVNGPGTRLVVFFQGCQRGCRGCFNPETHTLDTKELAGASGIVDVYGSAGIEGITVSGGEPFLQPSGLKALLESAKRRGLSTVVYTGFTIEELRADPLASRCLGFIDVLIDGPYDLARPETTLLARGSTNQRFHFLTGRYSIEDLSMPGRAEVFIGPDGLVRETGFSRVAKEAL